MELIISVENIFFFFSQNWIQSWFISEDRRNRYRNLRKSLKTWALTWAVGNKLVYSRGQVTELYVPYPTLFTQYYSRSWPAKKWLGENTCHNLK